MKIDRRFVYTCITAAADVRPELPVCIPLSLEQRDTCRS
jgi:hypothetical protein